MKWHTSLISVKTLTSLTPSDVVTSQSSVDSLSLSSKQELPLYMIPGLTIIYTYYTHTRILCFTPQMDAWRSRATCYTLQNKYVICAYTSLYSRTVTQKQISLNATLICIMLFFIHEKTRNRRIDSHRRRLPDGAASKSFPSTPRLVRILRLTTY